MKTSFIFALIFFLNSLSLQAQDIFCSDLIKNIKSKLPLDNVVMKTIIAKASEIEHLPSAQKQKLIMDKLWELEVQAKLQDNLRFFIKTLKKQEFAPPQLKHVDEELVIGMLYSSLKSEFYARGYERSNFKFSTTLEIAEKQKKFLQKFSAVTTFESPEFVKVFEKMTGAKMTSLQNIEVLADNALALSKRLELITGAKKEIKLMSWGYYDDEVGTKVATELIKAKVERNVVVQVLVDYQVQLRPGYGAQLQRMREAGIEVIGWKSVENPFFGMHSKMLMVDNVHTIDGGRNIGDVYMLSDKWVDLDVYHQGINQTIENQNIFAKLWNDQIDLQKLTFKKLPLKKRVAETAKGNTGTFLSYPQATKADLVSDMTIYSIMNAKTEIDIANAYFIGTPGIEDALKDALQRGVKVRIISNSSKSVDEPIVSIPIQKSLQRMYEAGAEIYLKEGSTLHTKIFRADKLSWYGSYNLHPRSSFYEVEKVTFSTDQALVEQLEVAFDDVLKKTKKVESSSDFGLIDNKNLDLLFELIFNQL
jgi:cardiolipin synthase